MVMMMITKKKLVKISFSFKKSSMFLSGCQQVIIDDQFSIGDGDVSGGSDSGGGDDESSSGSDFGGNYITNLCCFKSDLYKKMIVLELKFATRKKVTTKKAILPRERIYKS